MDLKKTFGKNLKRFRECRGLTQERFAELCNVSANHVSVIERGVNFPSASVIEVFSQILNVPPHMFFIGDKIEFLHDDDDLSSKFSLSARQRSKILSKIEKILRQY